MRASERPAFPKKTHTSAAHAATAMPSRTANTASSAAAITTRVKRLPAQCSQVVGCVHVSPVATRPSQPCPAHWACSPPCKPWTLTSRMGSSTAGRQLLTSESSRPGSHDQPMTQERCQVFAPQGGRTKNSTTRRSCHNSLSAHGRNRVAPSSLPCDHFLIKPCSA